MLQSKFGRGFGFECALKYSSPCASVVKISSMTMESQSLNFAMSTALGSISQAKMQTQWATTAIGHTVQEQ